MRGYHYTSWDNWQKIQKEGLIPYSIGEEKLPQDIFGPNIKGIWTWKNRMTGLAHWGQIIERMITHRSFRFVLVSYEYSIEDELKCIIKDCITTLAHTGSMNTSLALLAISMVDSRGIEWCFHKDIPCTILTNPIPSDKITVEATYDLEDYFDRCDGVLI